MATLPELHINKVDRLIEEEQHQRKSLKLKRKELAKAIKAAVKAGVPMEKIRDKMGMETNAGVYMFIERHAPKDEGRLLRKGIKR